MFSACEKKREDGRRECQKERKTTGRKKVTLLQSGETPPLQTFQFPSVPISAFSAFATAPFPSQLLLFPTVLKASRQRFTFRKPELGMLKRPGLAFFGYQLWQLSHPHSEGSGRSAQIPGCEQTGRNDPTPAEGAR